MASPEIRTTPPPDPGTFETLGLHPQLLQGIRELGFVRPTPIQAQAIPPVLAGHDVIGCAQTGTGKTAAFVLPILHRLLQGASGPHVRALIIAPTRELALQSMDHLKALSRYVHLKGTAIFGGVPMSPQISALAHGVDIISATPGRLLDHIYSGRINFVHLEVCVLDEADRMLDMGFLPDIQHILRLLPPKRQMLLFSATMPPEIMALAHQILHRPVTVQVAPTGEMTAGRIAAAAGIRHAVYPVSRLRKVDLLVELLGEEGMNAALVFTRTKRGADRLSHDLVRRGVRVSILHGDRSQEQRLRALDQFRRGRSQVMVATDIAARGIDIEDISHVVNFDVPHTPEDYVHRIGRTARAEATGDAVTLMAPEEEPLVREIEQALHRPLPRVQRPRDGAPAGAAASPRRSRPHSRGRPR